MLNEKKILVAGAGGLLGGELVKALLNDGSRVVAADVKVSHLRARLSELCVDLTDPRLSIYQIDLSDNTSIAAMFNSTEDLTGCVNCAYPRNKNYGKHFFDVAIEDFNENVALNLGSSFLLMQECARYFQRVKMPFALVNISSVYGVMAPKFNIYNNTTMTTPVEYAAVKSGLIHLSKYVAQYIADSRFRVNVVSPGGILDHQPEEFLDAYKKETYGKGMLDVKDVLGSIVFLLSSSAEFVNGQNIVVDDGFSI